MEKYKRNPEPLDNFSALHGFVSAAHHLFEFLGLTTRKLDRTGELRWR